MPVGYPTRHAGLRRKGQKNIREGWNCGNPGCLLFHPELGDHYSAHGLLALISLYALEYPKEMWSASSPANVIRITSVFMRILGCLSSILKAYPAAEYLSAVACVFFLLLRCSGLIDRKLLRQELDRMDKAR